MGYSRRCQTYLGHNIPAALTADLEKPHGTQDGGTQTSQEIQNGGPQISLGATILDRERFCEM